MGGRWVQQAKLAASDRSSSDSLGSSAAIDGDYIVVGALLADGSVASSGAAYVFYRNQGGIDNWGQQKKIYASDGSGYDYFGRSVDIDGEIIVVGATYGDGVEVDSGAAYVFEKDSGGGDNWGQTSKLTAWDGSTNELFGHSVAVDANRIAIGAINGWMDSSGGTVYVYDWSGGSWVQKHQLQGDDTTADDMYGVVSLNGDWMAVGAYNYISGIGAVYVYTYANGKWVPRAWDYDGIWISNGGHQMVTSDGLSALSYSRVGISVALADGYVIAGADHDDDHGTDTGSFYSFRLCSNADLNGDCETDLADLALMAESWLGGLLP
jgi:hypothetical protein